MLSVAGTLRAEYLTEQFAPLRAELELRRDTDFSGALDKVAKKQQKAVAKSLKQLDKSADEVDDDVVSLGKLYKLLSKVYPDEFTLEAEKSADLSDLVSPLIGDLNNRVKDRLALVEARGAVFEGKTLKKLTAKAAKARAKLTKSNDNRDDVAKRLKFLGAAAKLTVAGEKATDKAVGTSGEDSVVMLERGLPWVADGELGQFFTQDDTLLIQGERTDDDGAFGRIVLRVKGVTGPGTYTLTSANSQVTFQVRPSGGSDTVYALVSGQGTLEVITRDIEAPRIVAKFSVSLSHNVAGTIDIASGRCDISDRFFLSNSIGLP
jgi:hypothetical protein